VARHAARRRRVGLFMVYLLWWVSVQRAAWRGHGTIPAAGRLPLAFGEALLAVW
jgi:hypothetical protein